MKNLLIVIILLSLAMAAKASGIWGDNTLGDKADRDSEQSQDQLIQAELDNEIQIASGLKSNEVHKGAKSKKVTKAKHKSEEPMTAEMAILKLGNEIAAADAKAYQAEIIDHREKIKARKLAKLEKKKKLNQLKVLKASKKVKTLS